MNAEQPKGRLNKIFSLFVNTSTKDNIFDTETTFALQKAHYVAPVCLCALSFCSLVSVGVSFGMFRERVHCLELP